MHYERKIKDHSPSDVFFATTSCMEWSFFAVFNFFLRFLCETQCRNESDDEPYLTETPTGLIFGCSIIRIQLGYFLS